MKKLFALACIALYSITAIAQTLETEKDSISLDVMIGQMILTGIGDYSYLEKDANILDEIKAGKVGGVIFFEKNINTEHPKKQLKRTIDLLTEAATIPLFISIDEEGGRVNRLKPKYGFPETKQAGELGAMNNLDTTTFYANNTASTLNEFGFNLNYAPDVDVAINPDNPVIAKLGRSYSNDPKIVAAHAQAVIDVHRSNGVLTTLKHFPGHGSSKNDSHLGVADVSNTWQFAELMPYKYLLDSGRIDGVMTAHIINEHLDPSKLPATLSPYIISNILRGVLGYEGVVFTDDMQMHAISKNFGFEESIKMAIHAGVDVMLFCNNVPGNERRTPSQIHTIISNYVTSGEISVDRIQTSYNRIMKLKSTFE
ncbi:glycoside hydrolase family 3 protein [Reichenbachiella carrageenanivorans]|uniref:beta-N-acetylhexosaminidase n=1 Tax=Reichenbachiella carrageenanivorans TaxID=2979869 RepID=A0ABY6D385_9BACT|nr:glycoside hydrolase family 3 N-terminal domain-containing protein [Reichenbachiella carrageenanivorans]UXX80622.1 glycoside hydrolase family 3 protein [Reichenbachiella carrageenanivorans]